MLGAVRHVEIFEISLGIELCKYKLLLKLLALRIIITASLFFSLCSFYGGFPINIPSELLTFLCIQCNVCWKVLKHAR